MLSGSAYVQMMKEVDDMVNHNNMDMSALFEMPPFEFKAYRRLFIDKMNTQHKNSQQ